MNVEASSMVQNYFKSKNIEVILFEGHKTYESVKNHPDLYMFYDGVLFCEPSVDIDLPKVLGPTIGKKYPENIKYNLAKVGKYIIGLKAMVPDFLMKHFEEKEYVFIDTCQGYAKCSTGVVDDNSVITSDESIAKACQAHGIEVLLIEPGHIKLPGLSYGFIGGACLRVGQEMFFSGDIRKHPNYKEIKAFLHDRNLECQWTNEPLIDLGSFIGM